MKLLWSRVIFIFFILIFSCNNSPKSDSKLNSADSLSASVQALQEALRQSPDSIGIRYRLVEALANNGQFKQALSQTDSLILIDSSNPVFWYQRGILMEKSADT